MPICCCNISKALKLLGKGAKEATVNNANYFVGSFQRKQFMIQEDCSPFL